jgi:hypothetical protein
VRLLRLGAPDETATPEKHRDNGRTIMTHELDDIEKRALSDMVVARARADPNDGRPLTEMRQRPGEKVEKFWCKGCEDWHEGSVLGGPIGDPHGT